MPKIYCLAVKSCPWLTYICSSSIVVASLLLQPLHPAETYFVPTGQETRWALKSQSERCTGKISSLTESETRFLGRPKPVA
jgi:hypothetical protein